MDVTFKGIKVTLEGNTISLGDNAPDFEALDIGLTPVKLSDFDSKFIVISVVPSLDTGVCDFQTKRFNELVTDFDDVTLITISNDLPFAQKRWCGSEGLENIITLSDHKDLDFAKKYGTLMKEHRLLARSLFVLDNNREVVYKEFAPEASEHLNYEKFLAELEVLRRNS